MMTNGDWLRSLSNEELAAFIAHERFRMIKPVFDYIGYGVTEEIFMMKMLKWVNSDAENDENNA